MSEPKPQKPLGPESPILDYQRVGPARPRRNYAKIGGISIFLLYPCLIFARLICDVLFGMEDSDNLIFYLCLPFSLVPGIYGHPLMERTLFAFFTGLIVNATFWAALWVVPALIWED